ncbi:hypothetical protein FHR92_004145 [Fontibacillus solani]|uniref:Uncharacterized protein n=1 Tax=Fontibacillus solani TaxID=1572857 RepID=A0A7W3SWR2_9BACL|nr:hypothetical protein [Fontibacillus solani]MBA9087660.1 hypothetical protein [Fontibacillus solani]
MWTSFSNKENLISDMFKVALELEYPWELKSIEFDDQDQAWHLFLDFERGAEFACPLCEHQVRPMMQIKRTV